MARVSLNSELLIFYFVYISASELKHMTGHCDSAAHVSPETYFLKRGPRPLHALCTNTYSDKNL